MSTTKVDYAQLVSEHLDDLLVDGWQHGTQPLGLISAIAWVPSDRLDGKPSGKPSSRIPFTRQDTLRMDAESIIRKAHHRAMVELHGDAFTHRSLQPATHLRELLPELSRNTQRTIERDLKALVHRILVALKEKRPDIRIRRAGVFCPDHWEKGTKPPLFLRAFDEGNDDLATAVCHKCGRLWDYAELLFLGRMITPESMLISA